MSRSAPAEFGGEENLTFFECKFAARNFLSLINMLVQLSIYNKGLLLEILEGVFYFAAMPPPSSIGVFKRRIRSFLQIYWQEVDD